VKKDVETHRCQNIQQQRREISHITKKKKQFDSMSDSGANEDKLIKQKLSGIMESTGVIPTNETIQAMYEFIKLKKSMKSTKAPSPPSATQEVKSLPKMHVESQPKVDSPQEGRVLHRTKLSK
jgi:division protein CdvB (Snf7/Vps24/ESCRT-III family)